MGNNILLFFFSLLINFFFSKIFSKTTSKKFHENNAIIGKLKKYEKKIRMVEHVEGTLLNISYLVFFCCCSNGRNKKIFCCIWWRYHFCNWGLLKWNCFHFLGIIINFISKFFRILVYFSSTKWNKKKRIKFFSLKYGMLSNLEMWCVLNSMCGWKSFALLLCIRLFVHKTL